MNENEIITALECCISEEVQGCKDCPLLEFSRDCDECRTELMKQALDLIKRKNAESEELKIRNQNLTSDLTSAKAEIERLKNECFCLGNERDAYKDVLDTAVSEARKELAERLKLIIVLDLCEAIDCSAYLNDILPGKIDNLLAEMNGEVSGNERTSSERVIRNEPRRCTGLVIF